MNEFRMAGTVDEYPIRSKKKHATVFYIRTLRPTKGRKTPLRVKMVAFGKLAKQCYDLIKPSMRIHVFGVISTGYYIDKQCLRFGMSRVQAERTVLQCIVKGFTFSVAQTDVDKLREVVDLACEDDWEAFEIRSGARQPEEVIEVESGEE